MKRIKSIISVLICIIILMCSFNGCKKTEEGTSESPSSKFESGDLTVGGDETVGEFDNASDKGEEFTPTPGMNSSDSAPEAEDMVDKNDASEATPETGTDDGVVGESDNTAEQENTVSTTSESDTDNVTGDTSTNSSDNSSADTGSDDDGDSATEDEVEFEPSILKSEATKYEYKGDGYIYAITESDQEVIGFLDDDGTVIDVLNGAGEFSIYSSGSSFDYNGIKNFETSFNDGYSCVTVEYDLSDSSAIVKTVYTFRDDSISIDATVQFNSTGNIMTRSKFTREFLNSNVDFEKKISYDWLYPENGDYPRQVNDAMVTVNHLDSKHLVYTFNRDEKLTKDIVLNTYPNTDLPLYLDGNSNGIFYTVNYDLVLQYIENEKFDSDYISLFESKGSEFAAGITPVIPEGKTKDDTTVIVGDEAVLNINITNLTDDDLKFSLRYDIRDYYGNIVDSGLFINSTVFYGTSANRNVKVSGKYGIYYLNLYVVSEYSTHLECYPFALFEDYKFTYGKTNPFGIDALHSHTEAHRNALISLCGKLGLGIVRAGPSQELKDAGVERVFLTGYAVPNNASKKDTLVNNIQSSLKQIEDTGLEEMVEYIVVINEGDGGSTQNSYELSEQLMVNYFLPNVYNPLKSLLDQTSHKIAWAATCHAKDPFFTAMHKYGIWQDSEVIDTHIYAYPKGPDKCFANTATMESEMQNFNKAMIKFGAEGKIFSLGELGYPVSGSTSLILQADFNTRSGILALANGVDIVSYYSMLDRTGYYQGDSSSSMEKNFGAFYDYDYYGIFKPKPWAASLAAMTRQLESIESCAVNTKYDEDTTGTLRAFTAKTAMYGDVLVAWSNVFIPTGTTNHDVAAGKSNDPLLPWQTPWKKTEKVKFDATGDKVTVVDSMGNSTEYEAKDGKVEIELSGSPVFIHGVK